MRAAPFRASPFAAGAMNHPGALRYRESEDIDAFATGLKDRPKLPLIAHPAPKFGRAFACEARIDDWPENCASTPLDFRILRARE